MQELDKNIVDILYDVAVIGINNEGLSLVKPILDMGKTVCMLGESVKEIEDQATSAVTFYHYNVVFPAYKHGVICLTLSNKQIICCKNVIVADSPDKQEFTATCKGMFFDRNTILSERSTNLKYRNIVILGDTETALKEAEYFADTYRRVYLCTSKFDLKSTRKNIQVVYNVTDIIEASTSMFSDTSTIVLNNGTKILCDAIYIVMDKPNYSYLNTMIETDEDGYIKTDSCFRTTIVPTIFAVGQTTRTVGDEKEVLKHLIA